MKIVLGLGSYAMRHALCLPAGRQAQCDFIAKGGEGYVNRTHGIGFCRQFYPDQPDSIPTFQPLLAPIHCLCRRQPVPVSLHRLLPYGKDPQGHGSKVEQSNI
jgi:hypothetical protein